MKIIKANLIAKNSHIAIIVSRFNHFINNSLLEGAIDILQRVGHIQESNITVIWVPGAYELPLVANILVKSNKNYDAIIALGTVIRGETAHFEYISGEVSKGISNISINNNIPITFGILTTENIQQAMHRSGSKLGNKGSEAALAALEMINLLKLI